MSRIAAGFNQLKKAFEVHGDCGQQESGPSYYLLRFYSVECGLKSVYIGKNDKYRRLNSEAIPDHGHKLDQWFKELSIPASRIGKPPRFKVKHSGQTESEKSIDRIHEAWRYGVAVADEDEEAILRWLDDVREWLSTELKEL